LRSGALLLCAPEVDVKRAAGGKILLERRRGDEPARRAVSEAMVVVGQVAARFCIDHRVAAIYRRQPPPASELGPVDGPVTDPVALRRLRRRLKRGEAGIRPAPHFALGLAAYLQVTSPLRRYQDLAVQRQIAAMLDGEPPPYDEQAMQRIAATTERAEIEARRAERAANEFWLLRYLEQQTGQLVAGVIVEAEPRPVIQLVETLWEQPLPSLAGREAGAIVKLRVERVNPRAGLVSLRISEESGADAA
jgi:exoribonuclease-2